MLQAPKRLSWLLLLPLLYAPPARPGPGDPGSVSGTVLDAELRTPISYANVLVIGTDRGAMTDTLGAFLIDDLEPGTYHFRVVSLGYQPRGIELVVRAGRRAELKVEMNQWILLPSFGNDCNRTPESAELVGAPADTSIRGESAREGFGFRLSDDRGNLIDTFTGEVVKDLISRSDTLIFLEPTDEELDAVYRKVLEIGFFDYPEPHPALEVQGAWEPSCEVWLTVRADGAEKALTWSTGRFGAWETKEQWENLRDLVRLMECIVKGRPEYKSLPSPEGSYY